MASLFSQSSNSVIIRKIPVLLSFIFSKHRSWAPLEIYSKAFPSTNWICRDIRSAKFKL